MDPFARLPPEILRELLCSIPDLPTLSAVHDASPAVFSFLHCTSNRIPGILEAIFKQQNDDERRWTTSINLLRLMALIWWRSDSNHKNNPLPYSFEAIEEAMHDAFSNHFSPHDFFGPLSNSIPCHVTCRLIALSRRVRQITHVLFHDAIEQCIALKLERLKDVNDARRYTGSSKFGKIAKRPPGERITLRDVGPPSSVEEQRLTEGLLRVMLFYELRKAIVVDDILRGLDVPEDFLEMGPGSFWGKKMLRAPNSMHTESFRTVLAMVEQHTGSLEACDQWIHSSMPGSRIYCCPHLRPWDIDELRDPARALQGQYANLGLIMVLFMQINHNSPAHCVHRKFYRPFGLLIWDPSRLEALGMLWRWRPGEAIAYNPQIWYIWSSILTEEQWVDTHKAQRELTHAMILQNRT